MNSLIPDVVLLIRRAERLLTTAGEDHYNNQSPTDRLLYRRWGGENVEIVRYPDGDFYIKVTDPYWPDRYYAIVMSEEKLKINTHLVTEVNKRLEKVTVLDDLADS